MTGFLAARKSRFFDAEKLNIFFDTQKLVVPHGRGCFLIRNSVQAGSARHLVVLPHMESIVMASACAEGLWIASCST